MPEREEKHFVVTEVEFDDEGVVSVCTLEAVLRKRAFPIDWQELKDSTYWKQGWC